MHLCAHQSLLHSHGCAVVAVVVGMIIMFGCVFRRVVGKSECKAPLSCTNSGLACLTLPHGKVIETVAVAIETAAVALVPVPPFVPTVRFPGSPVRVRC